jgi:hypothetical protein
MRAMRDEFDDEDEFEMQNESFIRQAQEDDKNFRAWI